MLLSCFAGKNRKSATLSACRYLRCNQCRGHVAFSISFTGILPPHTSSSSYGIPWTQDRSSTDRLQPFRNATSLPAICTFEQEVHRGSNIRNLGKYERMKSLANSESYSPFPSNHNDRQLSFQSTIAENGAAVNVMALQRLKQKMSFLLSDLNLRYNKQARSDLQQSEGNFMPLDSMMKYGSIQKLTSDPSTVQQAVHEISDDVEALIKLSIVETDSGEIMVMRNPAFNYIESIRRSRNKMMIVEGWPTGSKPGKAAASIRSLLCTDVEGGTDIPIAYWRFDAAEGVLDIEFESEEGAMRAWDNLEQQAGSHLDAATESSPPKLEVRPLSGDQHNRSYQLRNEDLVLVARSIDMSLIIENMLPNMEAKSEGNTDINISEKSPETSVDTRKTELPPPIRWQAMKTPSLTQFTQAMDEMYNEHTALPPPSREWLHEYARPNSSKARQRSTAEDSALLLQRHEICNHVNYLLSRLKASINQGKIRALGSKDGYLLTDSLGGAMLIYSECPSTPDKGSDKMHNPTTSPGMSVPFSPFDACLDIFDILRSLNLDVHPSHFSYAIRAACHLGRWEEAACLFLGQVSDDGTADVSGGLVPINPALGWDQPLEVGLYAVARDSWFKLKTAEQAAETVDISPSKRVFGTAMKMCLLSSTGQDNYILAAGLALGRAGLWRDCLDFALDSDSISTYGPSIAAAAMLACIECSRSPEALHAYNFFMSGNSASEWQWAGGSITAVKPLCCDLALQAMGNVKKGGFGGDAMHIFEEVIAEDNPLSPNGLLGLAHSLEHDGDWPSSVRLLKAYIDSIHRKESPKWRLVPDVLELNQSHSANRKQSLTQSEQNGLLANIVASVMRVCNRNGQCGLAILFCSIANGSYAQGQIKHENGKITKNILSQKIVTENEQVLVAYMQSLQGLDCRRIIDELLDESQIDRNILVSLPRGPKRKLPHEESWINAFVAIDRVLKATDVIRSEGSNLSDESCLLFERGLGRAMDHCIDSKQPTSALYLFDHAITKVMKQDSSLSERVKIFFGVDDANDDKKTSGAIFTSDNAIDLKKLRLSDTVLAATIKAYSRIDQPEMARSIFYDGTMYCDDLGTMCQSVNSTLEALLDIDVNEGLSFLEENVQCMSPTTFMLIAKHYAKNGTWPKIGEVYNRARNAGCISEELGLITMQAVCESELLDGKIIILRRIVDDISRLVGMRSIDWINAKYWGIKRYVGFHYARLLMKWNDPATSQKEELLFAITEMRKCAREGITTKNAPLECIVKIAHVYGTDGTIETALSEKQRRSAVNLILEACIEAKQSGLIKKHTFTTEVVRSLRALGANKECIQVVVGSVISAGRKCRHRIAMEEAMYAALEERDHEALRLITDVFEKSGYDSQQLRI